jgi:hypothetical protein
MAGFELGIEETEPAEPGVGQAGGKGALAGARGAAEPEAQALGLGAVGGGIETRGTGGHDVGPPNDR